MSQVKWMPLCSDNAEAWKWSELVLIASQAERLYN